MQPPQYLSYFSWPGLSYFSIPIFRWPTKSLISLSIGSCPKRIQSRECWTPPFSSFSSPSLLTVSSPSTPMGSLASSPFSVSHGSPLFGLSPSAPNGIPFCTERIRTAFLFGTYSIILRYIFSARDFSLLKSFHGNLCVPCSCLLLLIRVDELPPVDMFVTTADPILEPPIITVNTVLSLLAVEYPANKLACYVSDDGASPLTFYALLEASKFAKLWVPFCKKYDIRTRAPFRYFSDEEESPHDDSTDFVREYTNMKVMETIT